MKRTLLLWLALATSAFAAEILRLDAKNFSAAPPGKEQDAIYGDWLLRNDRIAAVVAGTLSNRNIHLTFRNGQGTLIDLASREVPNDQLTGFIPLLSHTNRVGETIRPITAQGPSAVLRVARPAGADCPVDVQHDYRLRDGEEAVTILTRVKNTATTNVSVRLADKLRCDTTFAITPAGETPLVTAYDKWFGAAYGVQTVSPALVYGDGKGSNSLSGTTLEWGKAPGAKSPANGTVSLAPAQEVTLERRLITGRHEIEVQDIVRRLRGEPSARLSMNCTSSNCVAGVDISVFSGTNLVGRAQTDAAGKAALGLVPGNYTLALQSLGRSEKRVPVNLKSDQLLTVTLPEASRIQFDITDTASNAIPCKVQLLGAGETPTPDLGPKTRAAGCRNLYFSPNGKFSQEMPAGSYYVLITRGLEYDAIWRSVEVTTNATVRVRASLRRVIESRGWISADFHNHSTESGDNTTEAESRITCLAAEGVEFVASTEHNRIMTYRERLRRLGLTKFLATSDGIELTGMPGMLNHQNAFPLKWHRHAQSGGGPEIDADPSVQIERLARWDGNADKLVQQNHPDIGWLFFDKDGDGQPDDGFAGKKWMEVIEIWNGHASPGLDVKPHEEVRRPGKVLKTNNPVFNWLQLFNQGYRIWGVANTDAHYCFHDSGAIRNYVKSTTDDPARVREMDVVRESEKGHIIVSNGPFLETSIGKAGPGDKVTLKRGEGTLRIRVQCANWLDVDRVGVLVNGRQVPQLTWSREKTPALFRDGVVKFEHNAPLRLARDSHLIVVAQGDSFSTAPVMGSRGSIPVAIANPIFVDADGDGKFTPNGGWLGPAKPPVKSEWTW